MFHLLSLLFLLQTITLITLFFTVSSQHSDPCRPFTPLHLRSFIIILYAFPLIDLTPFLPYLDTLHDLSSLTISHFSAKLSFSSSFSPTTLTLDTLPHHLLIDLFYLRRHRSLLFASDYGGLSCLLTPAPFTHLVPPLLHFIHTSFTRLSHYHPRSSSRHMWPLYRLISSRASPPLH